MYWLGLSSLQSASKTNVKLGPTTAWEIEYVFESSKWLKMVEVPKLWL